MLHFTNIQWQWDISSPYQTHLWILAGIYLEAIFNSSLKCLQFGEIFGEIFEILERNMQNSYLKCRNMRKQLSLLHDVKFLYLFCCSEHLKKKRKFKKDYSLAPRIKSCFEVWLGNFLLAKKVALLSSAINLHYSRISSGSGQYYCGIYQWANANMKIKRKNLLLVFTVT